MYRTHICRYATSLSMALICLPVVCFCQTAEQKKLQYDQTHIEIIKPLQIENALQYAKDPQSRTLLKSYLNECKVCQIESLRFRIRLNYAGFSPSYNTKFDILKEIAEREASRILQKSGYHIVLDSKALAPLLSIDVGVINYNLNNQSYSHVSANTYLFKRLTDQDTKCLVEAIIWRNSLGTITSIDDVEHQIRSLIQSSITFYIDSMKKNNESIRVANSMIEKGLLKLEIQE